MEQKQKEKLLATRAWIRKELDTCIHFWLQHGMDKEHGGVYTCLDRKGEIYSTDKSVWMQGRCGWIFAYLCPGGKQFFFLCLFHKVFLR